MRDLKEIIEGLISLGIDLKQLSIKMIGGSLYGQLPHNPLELAARNDSANSLNLLLDQTKITKEFAINLLIVSINYNSKKSTLLMLKYINDNFADQKNIYTSIINKIIEIDIDTSTLDKYERQTRASLIAKVLKQYVNCDLNCKDDGNNTFLHKAAHTNDFILLNELTKVIGKDQIESKNFEGNTPLLVAAKGFDINLEIVRILMQNKADANVQECKWKLSAAFRLNRHPS